MFKRKEQGVSWYQDKYQHVLTQRNILAVIAIGSLLSAAVAAFAVMQLTPLKSVEPYLIQIDEKTGITQRVNPISRNEYMANQSVDRFFTATYLRMRETYNYDIFRYNYNIVRLMSARPIFNKYRYEVSPDNEDGFVKRLGTFGQREIRIQSMAYINNPAKKTGSDAETPNNQKIIQARITTVESTPNEANREQVWIATITFEYADLSLSEQEQLYNPLGYTVTSYQISLEGLE